MAGQETEKETWSESPESASDSRRYPSWDEKLSTERRNTLLRASSAAIRSFAAGFGNVSSASSRLWRHSWPQVSSASVQLYELNWQRVPSTTVQLYRTNWTKVSSTAARLYQHNRRELSSPVGEDWLDVFSTILRSIQWSLTLFIFITVTIVYQGMYSTDYRGRLHSLYPTMVLTLTYSSLAIVCFLILNAVKTLRVSSWHIVAISSIPGDLLMVCLCIAQCVTLTIRSFECVATDGRLGLSESYGNIETFLHGGIEDLRRSVVDVSNSPAFKRRLTDATKARCLYPSALYVACIIGACCYLASVALTVIQLLQYRKTVSTIDRGRHPGHIEQATPANISWAAAQMVNRGSMPPRDEPFRLERAAYVPSPEPSSSTASSLSSATIISPPNEPKYANMPAGIVQSMVATAARTFEETISSMDPDSYIVADGFRPRERPPSYTSSRESSLGPPEYRSRPPSLHAVLLAAPWAAEPETETSRGEREGCMEVHCLVDR